MILRVVFFGLLQVHMGSSAARRATPAMRSIGNRVQVPDGTAAVSAESPHVHSASWPLGFSREGKCGIARKRWSCRSAHTGEQFFRLTKARKETSGCARRQGQRLQRRRKSEDLLGFASLRPRDMGARVIYAGKRLRCKKHRSRFPA